MQLRNIPEQSDVFEQKATCEFNQSVQLHIHHSMKVTEGMVVGDIVFEAAAETLLYRIEIDRHVHKKINFILSSCKLQIQIELSILNTMVLLLS